MDERAAEPPKWIVLALTPLDSSIRRCKHPTLRTTRGLLHGTLDSTKVSTPTNLGGQDPSTRSSTTSRRVFASPSGSQVSGTQKANAAQAALHTELRSHVFLDTRG